MLIGEYNHNLDAKGRLSIPSKFRDDLGSRFILSRGLENCLYAYSVSEWENFRTELLSMRGKDARKVQRFFFGGSVDCEIDGQGRIIVPSTLREYANLLKEVVIVGVSSRAEIWDKKAWEDYSSDASFESEEIAEAMETMGF